MDFFSILDDESSEEKEFEDELDEEDEESFEEEEKKEEILDNDIGLPDEEESVEEENIEETENFLMDEVSDPALEMEKEEAEAPAEDDVIVEEEKESSDAEEALEPVETESEPSLDDSGEEDFVLPIATVDEEPLVKETEEETNHNPISSDSKEKEENSFVFDDSEDSKVLPKAESVENKKPPMSFTDNLFAALGMEDDEEDAPVEEVAESTATESPIEEMEEETSGEEIKMEDSPSREASIEETQEEQEGEECVMEDSSMEELQIEEEPAPPEIPGVIGEIYKTLGSSSSFAEFIKLSDEDTLSDLDDVIESCWNRQQMEGKDKMFNIPDYNLSIILARDSVRDELRLSELLNNAGGVMYSRDAENWNAVIVYIDSSHVVEKALERTITKDSFSPSDWKRVTYIGEQLKKR